MKNFKYRKCPRRAFTMMHPPPENKKPFDGFNSNIRQKAWTYFHPPPVGKLGQNQYDYTGTYRAAQRAALERKRGSTQVRDALHHCV